MATKRIAGQLAEVTFDHFFVIDNQGSKFKIYCSLPQALRLEKMREESEYEKFLIGFICKKGKNGEKVLCRTMPYSWCVRNLKSKTARTVALAEKDALNKEKMPKRSGRRRNRAMKVTQTGRRNHEQ